MDTETAISHIFKYYEGHELQEAVIEYINSLPKMQRIAELAATNDRMRETLASIAYMAKNRQRPPSETYTTFIEMVEQALV